MMHGQKNIKLKQYMHACSPQFCGYKTAYGLKHKTTRFFAVYKAY